MVCSCREELGYEVSGPESTGIGFQKLACPCLVGLSGEMELGIFDIVGTEVKTTRPDRMVCSCREELGYEVSGPESTGIGFHELDC
jgi:hypothetical protein